MGPRNMTKGSDMERQLTLIDCDENRLELWLKPDRMQLVVIDSRPELEAGELRRFASVLFAEYVAPGLADRLKTARLRLCEARDRAPGTAAALAAALDGALAAIDDLAAAVAIPERSVEPPEAEPDREPVPQPTAEPAPVAPPVPVTGRRPYPRLRALLGSSPRGTRAREPGSLRWQHAPRAAAR